MVLPKRRRYPITTAEEIRNRDLQRIFFALQWSHACRARFRLFEFAVCCGADESGMSSMFGSPASGWASRVRYPAEQTAMQMSRRHGTESVDGESNTLHRESGGGVVSEFQSGCTRVRGE